MSLPVGECVIDVGAIEANTAAIVAHVAARAAERGRPAPAVLAVVKADGYGHGLAAAAAASLAGGATWLGVATPQEALALRRAGMTAPVLCWLTPPGGDPTDLVEAGVHVTVSTQWRLDELLAAGARAGRTVDLQLKVDTGMGRSGVLPRDLPPLVSSLAAAVHEGRARLTGVWSHLASSEIADHPANDEQNARLLAAVDVVRAAGLDPGLVHLANSGAVLARPDLYHDLVRAGLTLYGYSPLPAGVPSPVELRPAMTLRSRLAGVKPVSAGQPVSYGGTWVAPGDTTLGLVPIGYADGILRAFSPGAHVFVGGRRAPIVGAVCMDQFVVDLGPDATDRSGDDVVLFGPDPDRVGVPSADDWASAGDTISWEVLTLPHGRIERRMSRP